MVAEIICIGTEYLIGSVPNENIRYLGNRLAEMGFELECQTVVADIAGVVEKRLDNAYKNGADLVVMTGAISPMKNDEIKEVIAAYFGKKLGKNKAVLQQIKDRASSFGQDELPEGYKKLAVLPTDSMIIENPKGVTPGFVVEKDGKVCLVLPNALQEMAPMLDDCAVRYLHDLGNTCAVSVDIMCKPTAGSTGEIRAKLEEYLTMENPSVAVENKDGIVVITVTAKAPTVEDATMMARIVAANFADGIGRNHIEKMAER